MHSLDRKYIKLPSFLPFLLRDGCEGVFIFATLTLFTISFLSVVFFILKRRTLMSVFVSSACWLDILSGRRWSAPSFIFGFQATHASCLMTRRIPSSYQKHIHLYQMIYNTDSNMRQDSRHSHIFHRRQCCSPKNCLSTGKILKKAVL